SRRCVDGVSRYQKSPRENFTGRAPLCGATSKHITLRHSRRLNLAIEAWDLFGTWVLGFGICLRSIISARERRDLWQRTDFLVWLEGGKLACLKEMDFKGYFAFRLPRGVMVAPEILDLFV